MPKILRVRRGFARVLRWLRMPATSAQPSRYPSPKATGGKLIREIIANLKAAGITLPLDSHILLATSAGADSTALAIAIAKYGRRVAPKSKLALLHVNHGWRGKESDADQAHVQKLAKSLGIECIVHKLQGPPTAKGQSWEDAARKERRAIFEAEARKRQAHVLTAHHADDLAETLLWRLFTGASETHGAGILLNDPPQLRPLLTTRRATLEAFLKEERQTWREDSSNRDPRFLRARMRTELMPVVEKLFPKAIDHLTRLGIQAQSGDQDARDGMSAQAGDLLFKLSGLRAKRAHYEGMSSLDIGGALTLADGWSVRRIADGWTLTQSNPAQHSKIPRKSNSRKKP